MKVKLVIPAGPIPAKHLSILRFLARRNPDKDAPLCTQEIGQAVMGFRGAATVATELQSLFMWGFVQKMGMSFSHSRCWAITDLGREALAKASPSTLSHARAS